MTLCYGNETRYWPLLTKRCHCGLSISQWRQEYIPVTLSLPNHELPLKLIVCASLCWGTCASAALCTSHPSCGDESNIGGWHHPYWTHLWWPPKNQTVMSFLPQSSSPDALVSILKRRRASLDGLPPPSDTAKKQSAKRKVRFSEPEEGVEQGTVHWGGGRGQPYLSREPFGPIFYQIKCLRSHKSYLKSQIIIYSFYINSHIIYAKTIFCCIFEIIEPE